MFGWDFFGTRFRGNQFRGVGLWPAARCVAEATETEHLLGVSVDRPTAARRRHFAGTEPADALPTMKRRDRASTSSAARSANHHSLRADAFLGHAPRQGPVRTPRSRRKQLKISLVKQGDRFGGRKPSAFNVAAISENVLRSARNASMRATSSRSSTTAHTSVPDGTACDG